MSTGRKIDYFAVLGLAPTASPDEIKQAYRRLARQYHPDLNDDPQTVERFREVAEAYRILSDESARAKYLLEQMEYRRTVSKKRVNVWDKKHQRRQNLLFSYLTLLFFAAFLLYYSADRLWLHVYLAYSAEPTTCLVERWQALSEEQYRLYYLAIVPWQVEPFLSWRDFSSLQRELPVGTVFKCYYNAEYTATQLKRAEWLKIFSFLPALLIGFFLAAYSLNGSFKSLSG